MHPQHKPWQPILDSEADSLHLQPHRGNSRCYFVSSTTAVCSFIYRGAIFTIRYSLRHSLADLTPIISDSSAILASCSHELVNSSNTSGPSPCYPTSTLCPSSHLPESAALLGDQPHVVIPPAPRLAHPGVVCHASTANPFCAAVLGRRRG